MGSLASSRGAGRGRKVSAFPIMLWDFYPLIKSIAYLLGARNCKSDWDETSNRNHMVHLPRVPLAAHWSLRGKNGKVPMTPGVKETPKGTCHLHFLLSLMLK